MKYFSTFSGIGGFELGIQLAYENNRKLLQIQTAKDLPEILPDTEERQKRITCVGFSEIDKYATAIYQKHFPTHKNYGNITTINAEELPDFDLLVGGFPCQAFSIAGKRKGFDDTRGTLFFDLARILRAKQPRLFLFENVKGLLSHDNGQTFRTIIATLDELGYDCQWQVLNSKNHGVPQNRERVFIVGHLRGTPRPQVFPFRSTTETTLGDCEISNTSKREFGFRKTSPTLLSRDYKDPKLVQLNNPTTMQGGNRQPFIKEEMKIRRLTPIECERLQGFPDGWTQGISDTQRYKCCGNAVTVNVIRDIAERLLKQ